MRLVLFLSILLGFPSSLLADDFFIEEGKCINRYMPKSKTSLTSQTIKRACEILDTDVLTPLTYHQELKLDLYYHCMKYGDVRYIPEDKKRECKRIGKMLQIFEDPEKYYELRHEFSEQNAERHEQIRSMSLEEWIDFVKLSKEGVNLDKNLQRNLRLFKAKELAFCILNEKKFIKAKTDISAQSILEHSDCIN